MQLYIVSLIKPGICILITQFQDKDPFKEDPNTEVNIGTVQVWGWNFFLLVLSLSFPRILKAFLPCYFFYTSFV